MIKNFSYIERTESLKKISSFCQYNHSHRIKRKFDLAIIGGGINGAGVARDAASRGMSVVLVEANDFAFGTSSRSSKLIHGGLRYLENFEFQLVFEALREKRRLSEIAPHLIHPLRFFIPIYKNSRVGMFKMGLGMWAYDVLSLFETPQMHERLSPRASLQKQPGLNLEGLMGSYVYSDAYTDDDRLVIETLRAANDWGACCLSYMAAVEPIKDNEKIIGIECMDRWKGGSYNIYAKHVVSTVGVWTDKLGSQILCDWKPRLCPTKGIHLIVTQDCLSMKEAVVLTPQDSSRIIFIIPRHDMNTVIIGTTDTAFQGDPSQVVASIEEVHYLLNIVNSYYPSAQLKVEDVVSSYAGVRPLVDDGSEMQSRVSREHVIVSHPQNVTFVMGGKYTTYRKIAEEVMEVVLGSFDIEDRVRFGHSRTKQLINPDAGESPPNFSEIEEMARESNFPFQKVEKLVKRYGYEAHKLLKNGLSAWEPCISIDPYLFIEIHHAIHNMMCFHLKDFYFRRMPLFLSQRDHGWSCVEEVAQVFSRYLNWDEGQKEAEIRALRESISREMLWKEES